MHLTRIAVPSDRPALAIHAGAGPRPHELSDDEVERYESGLTAALRAGHLVLAAGGPALDAVTAAVIVLEDDELFNAGRGAALNQDGGVEMHAAVMSGTDRSAGAVTRVRSARNPVLAARAVREHSPHVLMVDPADDLLDRWGIDTAPPEYFITERRREQLRGGSADPSTPQAWPARTETDLGHGTVGAVARDGQGRLAAATSTGGVTGQLAGRVGDTPVVGAGTYADSLAALSCTGIGEFFLRGVFAHDVAARMRYRGDDLEEAVRGAIAEHLDDTGGSGGLIAVDGTSVVLGFNTPAMFRGYLDLDNTPIALT